jgi:hypothetical protein
MTKGTISEHIKHVFDDGELVPEATVRLFRTVQIEGRREVDREVEHYNLNKFSSLGITRNMRLLPYKTSCYDHIAFNVKTFI